MTLHVFEIEKNKRKKKHCWYDHWEACQLSNVPQLLHTQVSDSGY